MDNKLSTLKASILPPLVVQSNQNGDSFSDFSSLAGYGVKLQPFPSPILNYSIPGALRTLLTQRSASYIQASDTSGITQLYGQLGYGTFEYTVGDDWIPYATSNNIVSMSGDSGIQGFSYGAASTVLHYVSGSPTNNTLHVPVTNIHGGDSYYYYDFVQGDLYSIGAGHNIFFQGNNMPYVTTISCDLQSIYTGHSSPGYSPAGGGGFYMYIYSTFDNLGVINFPSLTSIVCNSSVDFQLNGGGTIHSGSFSHSYSIREINFPYFSLAING